MTGGLWRARAAESLRRAAVHRVRAAFALELAGYAAANGAVSLAARHRREAAASVRLARWNVADARGYLVALANMGRWAR